MSKKTAKLLALVLAVLLLVSMAACTQSKGEENTTETAKTTNTTSEAPEATQESEEVSYLNTDSEMPIINEGFEIPLSIGIAQGTTLGDAENIWFWEYVRKEMNIQIEVEQNMEFDQYLSLRFASGDMPDMFSGSRGSFGPNTLVLYGSQEKQLIDLQPLMTEELMPNFTSYIAEKQHVLKAWTAPDGGVYSFGLSMKTSNGLAGAVSRWWFVNTSLLDDTGLEMPKTLDDFTAALKAMKGLSDDIVPLGGSSLQANPGIILLMALGYSTTESWGLMPSFRDGEVVIPAGDRERFGEYLTLMNEYYNEGLIEQDFFTLDRDTVNARMSDNKYGYFLSAPFVSLPDTWDEWWAQAPLTSEFSDTPIWTTTSVIGEDGVTCTYVGTGTAVITSNCEYTDVAARFVDWFYKPLNYTLSIYGPMTDDVDEMGYGLTEGWTMDPDTKTISYGGRDSSESYPYQCQHVFGIHAGQGPGEADYRDNGLQVMAGYYDSVYDVPNRTVGDLDLTNGNDQIRYAAEEMQIPYITASYPSLLYFSAEESAKISEYSALISDYVKQETAKFVTGLRPLSELDAYFDELDQMGFQEWQKYYIDYYNDNYGQ